MQFIRDGVGVFPREDEDHEEAVDAENEQNCTLASPRQSKQEGKLPFEQQHNDEECTVSVVAEELYLSEDMRRKGEEGRDHTREPVRRGGG